MESDRDFCCWQDLYNFPTKSTRGLGNPTHGGKVINSSGWQLLPHQVWDLMDNYCTCFACLYLLCHTKLSQCVQYRPLEGLWVHPLVHFYSLVSIIMRNVYSIRQIITPQESMELWIPWTHCSNFKGHNVPDAQLWQIKATDMYLVSWTAICNTTDFDYILTFILLTQHIASRPHPTKATRNLNVPYTHAEA